MLGDSIFERTTYGNIVYDEHWKEQERPKDDEERLPVDEDEVSY